MRHKRTPRLSIFFVPSFSRAGRQPSYNSCFLLLCFSSFVVAKKVTEWRWKLRSRYALAPPNFATERTNNKFMGHRRIRRPPPLVARWCSWRREADPPEKREAKGGMLLFVRCSLYFRAISRLLFVFRFFAASRLSCYGGVYFSIGVASMVADLPFLLFVVSLLFGCFF